MVKWKDLGTAWLSESGSVLVFALADMPNRFFILDINDVYDVLEGKKAKIQIKEKSS